MNNLQRKQGIERLKLAYTILATVPGVPCIYYGDEAGMEGYNDPFNRRPYPWGRENKELLEYYKYLGNIRINENLYKQGKFDIVMCNEDVLAFARYDEYAFVLTLVNRSNNAYVLNSNADLRSISTNRKISSIQPNRAYILKSTANFKKSNIKIKKTIDL
jgi:pullulanase